jgi:hypothetical protein
LSWYLVKLQALNNTIAIMLCDLCCSINFDAANSVSLDLRLSILYKCWPRHHSSFSSLQKAADDGCELCQLILPHAFARRPGSTPFGFVETDDPEQILYTIMRPGSDGANTIYFKKNFKGIENSLSFSLGLFARPGDTSPPSEIDHRLTDRLSRRQRQNNWW